MNPVRVVHISDSHFGAQYPETLVPCLSRISELQPDLILWTGDITQRATKKQFAEARQFLKDLKSKCPQSSVLVTSGNHDIPLLNFERIFTPYRKYHKYFSHDLESHLQIRNCSFVTINSTSRWFHKDGLVNPLYLESELKKLNDHAGCQFKVVGLHHPLDCKNPVDIKNLLLNSKQTLEICHNYNVDLIVGGHIHDPFVSLSKDRYPEIETPMILSVAGTCLSYRTRRNAPNSFNSYEFKIEIGCKAIQWSRWDLNQGQYTLKEEVLFKVQNGLWSPS